MGEDKDCNCAEDCDCGHDHEHADYGLEEVAYTAHYKIDALIALLVKKGVFSEEEYQKEIDTFYQRIEQQDAPEHIEA